MMQSGGGNNNTKTSGLVFMALIVVFTIITLIPDKYSGRTVLELGGEWDSSLGKCMLPGTTDENHLGTYRTDTLNTMHLTREYSWAGPVSYSKDITVPDEMEGKRLSMIMERTKSSTLIVDGDTVGTRNHITSRHIYGLPSLKKGKHHIEIIIDNSPSSVPYGIHGSHAWTENTQTNWNGILGDFLVEATDSTFVKNCKISTEGSTATIHAIVEAHKDTRARIKMEAACKGSKVSLSDRYDLKKGENLIEKTMDFGECALLWSEFHPSLYDFEISLKAKGCRDALKSRFGLRDFKAQGTQFNVNGFTTFLRGKHDGCVFPRTGYAPVDAADWKTYMAKAREFGINHIRFHSYTPPEAAFEAADETGMYLQVELPYWGAVDDSNPERNEFLISEGEMILEQFGSHPSFVMMSLGNELRGDSALMGEWVEHFREIDDKKMYCYGSNDFIGWKGPQDGEDFYVGARVGGSERFRSHVRGSHAFCDAEDGGILNADRPSTSWDYSDALQGVSIPVISHETGQYQVYPDFAEISRYDGVLEPYNLIEFKRRMLKSFGKDVSKEFQEVSGAWALECYKADMEAAIRTPGMAGFQLLDLQDYSGQGTALVGVLNSFMEEKNIPGLKESWTGSCSPLLPLARFDDWCLRTDQTLEVQVDIADYLEQDWTEELLWTVTSSSEGADDVTLAEGSFKPSILQGTVGRAGVISIKLEELFAPSFCGSMVITLKTGDYQNSYELFVFPQEPRPEEDIKIFDSVCSEMAEDLHNGKSVILIRPGEIGGLFTPDFWNYRMFKSICERNEAPVSPGTLSILLDHESTFAASFPTAEHTGWQWWSILKHANPAVLKDGDRAVISVVDNIERSLPLALVYETPVDSGHLLICTVDLDAISGTPEGQAFRSALKNVAAAL